MVRFADPAVALQKTGQFCLISVANLHQMAIRQRKEMTSISSVVPSQRLSSAGESPHEKVTEGAHMRRPLEMNESTRSKLKGNNTTGVQASSFDNAFRFAHATATPSQQRLLKSGRHHAAMKYPRNTISDGGDDPE